MRILQVIPAVAARYGGASVAALESCRALSACGHEVLLATTAADGAGDLDVPLGGAIPFEGVNTIFFARAASESYKWSPQLAAWLAATVARYDVVDVHAVFSHTSIAAGRTARRAGVPYVVRPHGALDPWSLARKAWRKQLLLGAGAERLLRCAARMQYTTGEEQRLAEEALPYLPPGAVIALGVDDACFAASDEGAGERERYVLAMSRLDAKKGLDLLIEAFHAATEIGPLAGWRLVIAGDGEPDSVAHLRRLAAAGPAADRIEFAGWVSGAEKQSLLRRASLFASPSLQENFGLSLAEAMAAGVPVLVAPGVNLAQDVAGSGAGWVIGRTVEEWRAAIAHALDDESERLRRGHAARRAAEAYRWRTHARALTALYDDVLSADRARAG